MWKPIWKASAPLTVTGLLMLPALAIAILGLILDPRIITGAPAWLKPAKFAISIAIYTFTLAWVFTLIPDWRRTRHIVGWVTAIVMILEVAIIYGQAYRGTASHFNVATPLDAALFTVMGSAIVAQTLTSIAVAVALWRQQFADRALGWAMRLGMTITIIGAFTGGLMTRPTQAQLAAARAGEKMLIVGAHTVGSPDGGPGLPGTGWSTEHGDLRIPHFMGLHALQVLPLIAIALRRRNLSERARVRLTLTMAASYFTLYGLLLMQALRGQPLLAMDAMAIVTLGIWGIATASGAWMSVHHVEAVTATEAI